MKPTARLLSEFFISNYGADPGSVRVSPLGRGSHGQGFRAAFMRGGESRRLIVKTLDGNIGLGHDYPSDRAAVFLLAMETFNRMPGHVKADDVLARGEGGRVFSIKGGREYYLVMEEAEGGNYFSDLEEMAGKGSLGPKDKARIKAMTRYLARLHSTKKDDPRLYYRKLRDTVGHGECLMGVFDTYSTPGFTNLREMASIERDCVDWRMRLKPLAARLCAVHGDFHPGNILFGDGSRFELLDRSRGEYGEAADDVTALTINYIFFSVRMHGRMGGAYSEALELFYDEYLKATGDTDILEVTAPFYAFRGAVVANPLFYPDVTDEARGKIFAFVHGMLKAERFDPGKVNDYIKAGAKYRKKFL